jgi:hypothetical protein
MNKPLTGITRVKQSKFLLHSQDGHLKAVKPASKCSSNDISKTYAHEIKERNIRITIGTAVT